MIKNRTAQLIFETVYCTLGLVGCVASLGIFDNINMIRWDFYVHFTNLSNFLCIFPVLCKACVIVAASFGRFYVHEADWRFTWGTILQSVPVYIALVV